MTKTHRLLPVLAALGLCLAACKTHGPPEDKSNDRPATGSAAPKKTAAAPAPRAAMARPTAPAAQPNARRPQPTPPGGPAAQPQQPAGKPIDQAKLNKAFEISRELFTAMSAANGDCKKAAAAMLSIHKKHPELQDIRKEFNGNPVAQQQLMGRTRRELAPLLQGAMTTSRKCQSDPEFRAASKKMAGR